MYKPTTFKAIADYIFKNTGILYEEKNWFQLEARIASVMKMSNMESESDLILMLSRNVPHNIHTFLVDIATNNETFFFRDAKLFTLLEKKIFPDILAKNKNEIQAWSLACSTGQEAYSIKMSWEKVQNKGNCQLKILLSDISSKVLSRAKAGIYTNLEVQRGLSDLDLKLHFTHNSDNTWSVKEHLKSNLQFSEFNMLNSVYPLQYFDIIFCRNTLIYQNIENRKKIIEKIFFSLKPEGILILGNSENILGLSDNFHSQVIDGCSVFIKNKQFSAVG